MSISKREFTKRIFPLILTTISGCASDPFEQKKTTYDHPYRLRVVNYSSEDLTLNVSVVPLKASNTENAIKKTYNIGSKKEVNLDEIVIDSHMVRITIQIVNGAVEEFTLAPYERVILEIQTKNDIQAEKIEK